MTNTVKAVNYSEEQIVRMKTVYREADTDAERKEAVQTLADEFGKTINSIRAKLAGMKVYVKPAKTTKSGAVSVTKAKLVEQLTAITGATPELMDSLEGATKNALNALLTRFAEYEAILEEYEATAIDPELSGGQENS